jgi:hypothetical protein
MLRSRRRRLSRVTVSGSGSASMAARSMSRDGESPCFLATRSSPTARFPTRVRRSESREHKRTARPTELHPARHSSMLEQQGQASIINLPTPSELPTAPNAPCPRTYTASSSK